MFGVSSAFLTSMASIVSFTIRSTTWATGTKSGAERGCGKAATLAPVMLGISWLDNGKGWLAGAGRIVAGRAIPVGEGARLGDGLDRDLDYQEFSGSVDPDDRFQDVVTPDDFFLAIGEYGHDDITDW